MIFIEQMIDEMKWALDMFYADKVYMCEIHNTQEKLISSFLAHSLNDIQVKVKEVYDEYKDR